MSTKYSRGFSLMLVGILLAGCAKKDDAQPPATPDAACAPAPVVEVESVQIAPGLTSKTMVAGCGDVAQPGDIAVVHYTGWLYDETAQDHRGEKFDSSRDRRKHFDFPLGAGRVIKGWDQGVAGMATGEVRELTIAPELAYGERDLGIIPPGSTLVFEVELAEIRRPPPAEPQTATE